MNSKTVCPGFHCCFFSNRYCPGGPDSDFEYSTQSYTGYEVTILPSFKPILSDTICRCYEIRIIFLVCHPLAQPTSMRAIRARYDPYLQTRHRVEQVSHLLSSHPSAAFAFYYQNLKRKLFNGVGFTIALSVNDLGHFCKFR